MIETYTESDFSKLKEIHESFYEKEFPLADYFSPSLGKFVIRDDRGGIVVAASVRTLAEVVALTDKTKTVRERRAALYKLLEVAGFIANNMGHNQVHAFVQDPLWEIQLKNAGFIQCKGKALVIGV